MTTIINCPVAIRGFQFTKYMVNMLERCTDKLERDRILLFMNELTLNHRHVKEIMDANGINNLVHLLAVAHSHITQTIVIEAEEESEKVWFFEKQSQREINIIQYRIQGLFTLNVAPTLCSPAQVDPAGNW